jgi:hypothetical protein
MADDASLFTLGCKCLPWWWRAVECVRSRFWGERHSPSFAFWLRPDKSSAEPKAPSNRQTVAIGAFVPSLMKILNIQDIHSWRSNIGSFNREARHFARWHHDATSHALRTFLPMSHRSSAGQGSTHPSGAVGGKNVSDVWFCLCLKRLWIALNFHGVLGLSHSFNTLPLSCYTWGMILIPTSPRLTHLAYRLVGMPSTAARNRFSANPSTKFVQRCVTSIHGIASQPTHSLQVSMPLSMVPSESNHQRISWSCCVHQRLLQNPQVPSLCNGEEKACACRVVEMRLWR